MMDLSDYVNIAVDSVQDGEAVIVNGNIFKVAGKQACQEGVRLDLHRIPYRSHNGGGSYGHVEISRNYGSSIMVYRPLTESYHWPAKMYLSCKPGMGEQAYEIVKELADGSTSMIGEDIYCEVGEGELIKLLELDELFLAVCRGEGKVDQLVGIF